MKKLRTVLGMFAVFAMTLSATNPAAARVTGREVKNFFAELERMQQAAREQLQEQAGRVSFQWIQPRNKEVECKVIYAVDAETRSPDPALYWDGECKDGYASGLGREFFDSAEGLSSWLGEYGEPGEKPVYFYVHDYDSKSTSVGFNDTEVANPVGINGVLFEFSGDGPDSSFYVRQQYYDPASGRAYFLATNSADDIVAKGISYSAGPGFLIQTYLNPTEPAATWTYFLDTKGTPLRFGIARMRNGQVVHIEYEDESQQREDFPIELLEQFTRLEWEINAKLKLGQDNYEKGNLAVEAYKRRICRGDLDVDFMDPMRYGQICLEHGDFTPFIDAIRQATDEAKKRQEDFSQRTVQQEDIMNSALSTFWNNFSLPTSGSSTDNRNARDDEPGCHVAGTIVSCDEAVDPEQ